MRLATVAGLSLGLFLAGGVGPAPAAELAVLAQAGTAYHNCTCRAQGRSYQLGERVCLATPRGYRVAECRMQQNVTSWNISAEDCSVSAGGPPQPPASRPKA